jgi:hypothetical protein
MNDETKVAKHYDRILRLIRSRPGIPKAEIVYATDDTTKPERNAILDQLVTDGKIRAERTPTNGRTKNTYWLVEAHASPQTQPDADSSDGEYRTVKITTYEISLINADRQRQNEVLARHGKPALPMLPA